MLQFGKIPEYSGKIYLNKTTKTSIRYVKENDREREGEKERERKVEGEI